MRICEMGSTASVFFFYVHSLIFSPSIRSYICILMRIYHTFLCYLSITFT